MWRSWLLDACLIKWQSKPRCSVSIFSIRVSQMNKPRGYVRWFRQSVWQVSQIMSLPRLKQHKQVLWICPTPFLLQSLPTRSSVHLCVPFHSSAYSVHTNLGSGDERFGLLGLGQRVWRGNEIVGRECKAWGAFTHVNQRPHFRVLSVPVYGGL